MAQGVSGRFSPLQQRMLLREYNAWRQHFYNKPYFSKQMYTLWHSMNSLTEKSIPSKCNQFTVCTKEFSTAFTGIIHSTSVQQSYDAPISITDFLVQATAHKPEITIRSPEHGLDILTTITIKWTFMVFFWVRNSQCLTITTCLSQNTEFWEPMRTVWKTPDVCTLRHAAFSFM